MALRQKYDVQIPHSDWTIYVRSFAAHHLSDEYSTIAWRDDAGRWQISTMGEQGPALLAVPFEPIAETRKTLLTSEGVELDRLLRDKALYDEKSHSKDNRLGVGVVEHTMEIVTPRGRKVVTWIGRLVGRTGKVADLVMGRG
ncbi:MAG: hypothetical protein JF564_06945 [Sphingomonas sp.]|nr:hypothetical protein [Sphingomonas sp.]